MKYMPLLNSLGIRGVFLDTSKAFDPVWHENIIYKRKYLSVKSDILTVIIFFSFERQQSVVMNGQEPEWSTSKPVCFRV